MKKLGMNSKRWLALAAAIIIFVLSFFSNSFKNNNDNNNNNYIKNLSKSLKTVEISGKNPSERILVIDINGIIASGNSYFDSTYNHNNILNQLDDVINDSTIKGLILRINSPGGGTYESAQIYNKIKEVKTKRKIPVYTSMGSMAASGGYYISAATDKIYASNETLTGSIGVIIHSINYADLMKNLGIKDQSIKSGEMKDILSPSHNMTPDEKSLLQNIINLEYNKFLDIVSKGRHISIDKLKPLADGRIFNGTQAVQNGLVDKIGYFEDVSKDMISQYKLNDPIIFYQSFNKLDFFDSLFNNKLNFNKNNLTMHVLEKFANDVPKAMYLYGGNDGK